MYEHEWELGRPFFKRGMKKMTWDEYFDKLDKLTLKLMAACDKIMEEDESIGYMPMAEALQACAADALRKAHYSISDQLANVELPDIRSEVFMTASVSIPDKPTDPDVQVPKDQDEGNRS